MGDRRVDDAARDVEERVGPYRIGEKAFSYRDGLRRRTVEYGTFDCVFKRAMLCSARHCGGVDHFDTYWVVFCRDGKELCAAKTIDEKYADRALELIHEKLPEVKIGLD